MNNCKFINKYAKHLVKQCVPPCLINLARYFFSEKNIRFEGPYVSWGAAAHNSHGYDSNDILERVLSSTLMVKNGDAACERDSVLFDEIQYSWPVTTSLMWAAAINQGRLHVLDFGGSLGSSYFQNRKFLTGLQEVSWSVVEQPHYVIAGQELIANEELTFHSSIESCLKFYSPNVVLLSSVLQYLEDADRICQCIRKLDPTLIVIDRTPFNEMEEDLVYIQHVPDYIYKASYPMRVFSYKKFLNDFLGWQLVEKFKCPEGVVTSDSGDRIEFSGLIFVRQND